MQPGSTPQQMHQQQQQQMQMAQAQAQQNDSQVRPLLSPSRDKADVS